MYGDIKISGHGDDLCEVEGTEVDPPGVDEYSNTHGEFVFVVVTRDQSEHGPIGAVRVTVEFTNDGWTITPSPVADIPTPAVTITTEDGDAVAVIKDAMLITREANRDG